jgi:hypothetical protein
VSSQVEETDANSSGLLIRKSSKHQRVSIRRPAASALVAVARHHVLGRTFWPAAILDRTGLA